MTTIDDIQPLFDGHAFTGWLRTACAHRWHWRHPRFHAVPLTGHHTEGNGLGGTVTWA